MANTNGFCCGSKDEQARCTGTAAVKQCTVCDSAPPLLDHPLQVQVKNIEAMSCLLSTKHVRLYAFVASSSFACSQVVSSAIDFEVLLARHAGALWRKHCKAAGTLSAFGFSTSVLVKLTGGTA